MAARFEESSVSRQKDQPCRSGRKANINPELISYRQFLNAIGSNNGLGGLGCGDEFPYVTYEDGKYCCAKDGMTNQQLLDYINMLLESAMSNTNDAMFQRNLGNIQIIIGERNRLLALGSELRDNIVLPTNPNTNPNTSVAYNNVNEWLEASIARSNALKYDPRHMYGYPSQQFSDQLFDSTPQKVPLSSNNIKAINAISVANYNERILNEKEVIKKKKQPTTKFKPPSRPSKASEKEGGKTIKRKITRMRRRKRNNSKKGGSRKKRTTRNKRK
jgi:hypothetical protein